MPGALGAIRRRVLRTAVLTRMLLLHVLGLALAAYHRFDPLVTAAIVAGTAGATWLVGRVRWNERLDRPGSARWRYGWSLLDIALVTGGIAATGGTSSGLFVLYALATVVYAVVHPPRGQAVLLGVSVACYLGVVALDGWDTTPGAALGRVGGLVLVSYVASYLARELLHETVAHSAARVEAEARATALAAAAKALWAISSLDPVEVLGGVVDSAVELGFDGGELCVFDEPARCWYVAHRRGPSPNRSAVGPIDDGPAGVVWAGATSVVLAAGGDWPPSVQVAFDAGYRFLVASPVRSGGELIGALVTGSLTRDAPLPHHLECIELLAAHAGVALRNARLYTERRGLEIRLEHQAFHDTLTGLPNRALFHDRLNQALARTRRDDERRTGVLFVDLDGFKVVNDKLGHDIGDQLLAAASERLHACLRPGDTLARYGGDEFTVLLEQLHSRQEAAEVAERLLRALSPPFVVGGRQASVSASIGVSYAARGSDASSMLREADLAMYRAKEEGSGRWRAYVPEMGETAGVRSDLERDLREAFDLGHLYLAYQPQVDLVSGRIVAVEALARWRHATRGVVGPAEFVPAAERAGLGGRLGAWALEEACRQAREWDDAGLPELGVAVNVAAAQLAGVGFPGQVEEILRRNRIAPGRLTLETSEASLFDADGSMDQAVGAIDGLGVHLAVDDFGRGRTTLRALRGSRVRSVKVDRSLVQAVVDDPGDRAVARSLVALAGDLGIEVVAHGVETAAQAEQMGELGCRAAQGYWFSPPVAPPELALLLGP